MTVWNAAAVRAAFPALSLTDEGVARLVHFVDLFLGLLHVGLELGVLLHGLVVVIVELAHVHDDKLDGGLGVGGERKRRRGHESAE